MTVAGHRILLVRIAPLHSTLRSSVGDAAAKAPTARRRRGGDVFPCTRILRKVVAGCLASSLTMTLSQQDLGQDRRSRQRRASSVRHEELPAHSQCRESRPATIHDDWIRGQHSPYGRSRSLPLQRNRASLTPSVSTSAGG